MKNGKRKIIFPPWLTLLIILPAAICLYLYAAHFRVVGLFHDDGIYLVCAKSLYQGTGYSTISLPGSPPQTKYPPVLPLILSLLWRINPSFPENILLMRLLSALCAVLVLPLAWFYLRLKSSYTMPLTFLFLGALAFNPYFALLAGQVMSEIPFTLFSLASIVLFLHYERSGRKTSLYTSLLLAVIAFYTRTIGVALFLSFLLWFLYQRRFKAFFLLSGLMFLATIPWFHWVYRNVPATDSLVSAYYSSYLSWFILAVRSISYDVVFFAKHLLLLGITTPLLCPLSRLSLPILTFLVVFWFFFLTGLLNQFKKTPSVDSFYLLITLVVVALWTPELDPTRFLIPILPILLFHLMQGVKAVREDINTLSPSYKNLAHPLWLVGVAVLLVGVFVMTIPRTVKLIQGSPFNNEASFHCIEETCAWINRNTKRGDIVASHLDPLVYLLSERPAINVAWGNSWTAPKNNVNFYNEHDIIGAIKHYKVNYLLEAYLHRWWEDELRDSKLTEIIAKYPRVFDKCYEKEGLFAIYRVKPDRLDNKHLSVRKSQIGVSKSNYTGDL